MIEWICEKQQERMKKDVWQWVCGPLGGKGWLIWEKEKRKRKKEVWYGKNERWVLIRHH